MLVNYMDLECNVRINFGLLPTGIIQLLVLQFIILFTLLYLFCTLAINMLYRFNQANKIIVCSIYLINFNR